MTVSFRGLFEESKRLRVARHCVVSPFILLSFILYLFSLFLSSTIISAVCYIF
jgi:hypothetical protein